MQYNVTGGFFSDDIMVLVRPSNFGAKPFLYNLFWNLLTAYFLKTAFWLIQVLGQKICTLTKNGGRIQTLKFAISDFDQILSEIGKRYKIFWKKNHL